MTDYKQPRKNWTASEIPDLTDKIAVITGGTSGIGKETAREMARKNATVYLVARNREKGELAKEEIIESTKNKKVYFESMDLSSMKAIKSFSDDLNRRIPKLDILVNDAGIMMPAERHLTEEGFELMYATNYLGPFYLTYNLLPLLKKSDYARILNLASLTNGPKELDLTNADGHDYDPQKIYMGTKFGQAQIARTWNRIFKEKGYNINAMAASPGVASTNLVSRDAGADSIQMRIASVIFKIFPGIRQSPAEGALPILYGATDKEAQGGAVYAPNGRGGTRGYPALWGWNDLSEMNDKSAQDNLYNGTLKLLKINADSI